MHWIADILYACVGVLYLPFLLYQVVVQGKNRSGWRERFGRVPVRSPDVPRIWVHAVSLGEINATPCLVALLRERRPDCDIVVSTTTDTGYARAVELYGLESVFRFPLDFSLVVRRALNRIRPSLIVLMELEVWYNLVLQARERGIDVAVVNGRLTEHSARRLRWLGPLVRPMFSKLTWVGAQDATIAERFISLGVARDRVEVTSSLKWDSAAVSDSVEGTEALATAMGMGRAGPIWVCGSTGPGEEEIILDAFQQIRECSGSAARGLQEKNVGRPLLRCPQLVIVPRKPERFDEVAGIITRRGYICRRRSEAPGAAEPSSPAAQEVEVFLGDTIGELRKFYSLADVVFVGRTLVSMGGSDPMEVAALGKPFVVGPHTQNFVAPIRDLADAGALSVIHDAGELARAVVDLLTDHERRQAMGAAARSVVIARQGATARTTDRLLDIMARRSGGASEATLRPASAERTDPTTVAS